MGKLESLVLNDNLRRDLLNQTKKFNVLDHPVATLTLLESHTKQGVKAAASRHCRVCIPRHGDSIQPLGLIAVDRLHLHKIIQLPFKAIYASGP